MEKEITVKQRNSSLELLRIICMFFIVFHHFMLNSAFPAYESDVVNYSGMAVDIARFLNGFCCVAVNCFILITGYFGLRFKVGKLLNLYLICAFYGMLGYLLHLYLDGAHFGRSFLDYTVFALSNSRWWFINCYVVLLFTAPLLNTAIKHLNKEQYSYILLLLTIVNIYFGFFGGETGFNQYGYNVGQFVYLYMAGGYLSRYIPLARIQTNRRRFLLLFLILSFCIALAACISARLGNDPKEAYYYNNPLVIVSSCALFCFMLSFEFYNRTINLYAASAVSVYVFQEQPFIGYKWLYPQVQNLLIKWGAFCSFSSVMSSILCEFVVLFFLSFLFVIAILLFDQFRVFLMKPVWSLFSKLDLYRYRHCPSLFEWFEF